MGRQPSVWLVLLCVLWNPFASAQVIHFEPLAAGFDRVTGVEQAAAAGNHLYVVEQVGRVRIVDPVDGSILPTPFLDIRPRVLSGAFEQGLTSMVFAPAFPADPRLFVHYIRADGASVVSGFALMQGDPMSADADSEQVLITLIQPHPTHNCNQLAFGPDGYLYIGCGDGGSGSGPILNPQWLGHLYGKLLRIDIDTNDPGLPYAIPSDNPHVGDPVARGEIWANGLRNPYRFSFDRATGELWLADVGHATWEEINHVPDGLGGVNFGWPILEGSHCWPAGGTCNAAGYWLPRAEYRHTAGRCAVVGGLRLRAAAEPTLEGAYVYADFCTGEVFALREGALGQFRDQVLGRMDGMMPTAFGVTTAGELLVGTYGFGSAAVMRVRINDAVFASDFELPSRH